MSRESFPIGSEWRPTDPARTRMKRVVKYHSDPMLLIAANIRPDGALATPETFHWEVFRRMYEPAHYAHPGGGESGTCRETTQDDV